MIADDVVCVNPCMSLPIPNLGRGGDKGGEMGLNKLLDLNKLDLKKSDLKKLVSVGKLAAPVAVDLSGPKYVHLS